MSGGLLSARTGSLRQLRSIKPVWKEPQGGSAEELEESIQEYYVAIKSGQGGIFFAVCRGKVRMKHSDSISLSLHFK